MVLAKITPSIGTLEKIILIKIIVSLVRNFEEYTREKNDKSWVVEYEGAECKFEAPDPHTVVVHHLFVPEELRGQGLGTELLEYAEEKCLEELDEVHMITAQIQESGGATQRILKKRGFEILEVAEVDSLGLVVDAAKYY